jgi:hypothetical protein
MKSEVFVSVVGEPDFLISNKGRVYNKKTKRFRKPTKRKGTYYFMTGKLNNKTYTLHVLVGRHFLPHTGTGLILHKEENLSDAEINSVENLWVGTYSENTRDGFSKGRITSNFVSYNNNLKEGDREQWNKGKTGLQKHSAEAKAKISAAVKERWRLWRLNKDK